MSHVLQRHNTTLPQPGANTEAKQTNHHFFFPLNPSQKPSCCSPLAARHHVDGGGLLPPLPGAPPTPPALARCAARRPRRPRGITLRRGRGGGPAGCRGSGCGGGAACPGSEGAGELPGGVRDRGALHRLRDGKDGALRQRLRGDLHGRHPCPLNRRRRQVL